MAPPKILLLKVLSVVGHNTLRFRGMRNFDIESFFGDLIACGIHNGSQIMMKMMVMMMMMMMIIYHVNCENLHTLTYVMNVPK